MSTDVIAASQQVPPPSLCATPPRSAAEALAHVSEPTNQESLRDNKIVMPRSDCLSSATES